MTLSNPLASERIETGIGCWSGVPRPESLWKLMIGAFIASLMACLFERITKRNSCIRSDSWILSVGMGFHSLSSNGLGSGDVCRSRSWSDARAAEQTALRKTQSVSTKPITCSPGSHS
jgi:hypothetical protein